MPRSLTIVAAGEALLDETGPEPIPAGLALRAAGHAVRLGHLGVAVARVGQDSAARTLLGLAHAQGINVEHVQSDPDLPTGRRSPQRFGGGAASLPRSAFDNLQWDHDLVDLAMRAHVIITGALARRNGQTRAEIDRFVGEGRTALKVFDLVNRDEEQFERREQIAMLELVDGVVIDRRAAEVIVPARRGGSLMDAAREMRREFKLEFAIVLEGDADVALVTPQGAASHELGQHGASDHELLVTALTHFIAHGCTADMCVDRAVAVVAHARKDPAGAFPESLIAVK